MAVPKFVVLVRHGESESNTKDKFTAVSYGAPKIPLTELGRKQAKITGAYLRDRFGAFDRYFSSYFLRACDTMAIMYPEALIEEDALLSECGFGVRDMFEREEFAKRFPEEERRKNLEGLYYHRPPGGENALDVEHRVRTFFNELVRICYAREHILIVGHGTWITLFRKYIEGWTVKEFEEKWAEAHPKNASVLVYERKCVQGRQKLVFADYVIPWQNAVS